MKKLLITIAAVVMVGCGPSASDISIHDAAAGGHIKAIKHHLDSGTDVNEKDELKGTPLHNAAHGGHKQITELLIAKGADVNANDNQGFTPLDAAIIGKAAFLEPDIFMFPLRVYPPLIANFFNGLLAGAWRPCIDTECVDFLLHIVSKRSVNHLMPFD